MAFNTFFAHGLLHAGSHLFEPLTRVVNQATADLIPNELPPVDAMFDLARRGWISERALTLFSLKHGVPVDPTGEMGLAFSPLTDQKSLKLWNQVYYAHQTLPTMHEFLTLANRMRMSNEELDLALTRLGFYNEKVRDDVKNLRYEIPSSSDLVRFSVRHVFEPDLIERLGYNDEFRPILDLWHRFQGLNYPIFTGPFADAVGRFEESRGVPRGTFIESYAAAGLEEPTWAKAWWWSHWVLPSPTQGYEMYFRYRPERDHRFDAAGTEAINFGLQDLELLLRANDYPPKFRPLLAGIAHRLPGVRFLRQLRATGVFGKHEVKELLLRQGYSQGDAEVLSESVERNDRDQRRRGIEQQAKGQLAKYWELGVLNEDTYKSLLLQHGLEPGDADQAVKLAQLDLQFKRVGKIVEFVRRQFLKGAVTAAQATGQLRQAGVVDSRVALYIEDWKLELTAKHREISAGKAVQWACKGFITINDLRTRLVNLGYSAADSAGLVAEAAVCSQALEAKARAAAVQAARQQQRQLQSTQRDAARAIVTARRQLASHGSPAQLRKWFCQGHVGELEVYSRLRFLGWPDVDITRLIGDCKSATGKPHGGPRGGQVIGGSPPGAGAPPAGGP